MPFLHRPALLDLLRHVAQWLLLACGVAVLADARNPLDAIFHPRSIAVHSSWMAITGASFSVWASCQKERALRVRSMRSCLPCPKNGPGRTMMSTIC